MGVPTRLVAVLAMTATALAATVFAASSAAAAPASIRPVPRPPIYPASTTYTLRANDLPVPISAYAQYDYAQFSMGAGTALLTVSKLNNTNVGAAYISPIKQGYVATRSGSTASFTIRGPEYLIVKLDGRRPLVIAADPAETDTPANKGPDIFNVTEGRFGADPTGSRPSTAAIQAALDAASAYGSRPAYPRGIVYVPRGVYSVANLDIRSNTSLYLEPGAVLRAVAQKNLYTIDARKDSQNRDLSWWIQTAFSATNIKIFGRGTLDGNGPAMLNAGLGLNVLAPIAASKVTVDGVTVREASSWSVIPVRSNDISFTNLKLLNRFDMGENDGIDVVESQNVTVRRGIGIGLDDPYTTKSYPQMTGDIGRNWPGQPERVQNVLFDRLISWTYCYGYKVGQGVYNDHENVTFSNSVVYDAAVGIGIHHKAHRGAARRITFSNIDIEKLSFSNDGNRTWLAFMIADAANDGGGPITDVTVSHVNVRSRGTTAAKLTGLSASAAISGVQLDSIRMPGSTGYATTLEQMNITDRRFVSGITITP